MVTVYALAVGTGLQCMLSVNMSTALVRHPAKTLPELLCVQPVGGLLGYVFKELSRLSRIPVTVDLHMSGSDPVPTSGNDDILLLSPAAGLSGKGILTLRT